MRAQARTLIEEGATLKATKNIMQTQIHRVLVVERRRDKDALVDLVSLLDLAALLAPDECDG